MKKTYISPELLIVQMRPVSAILQASTMSLDNAADNALNSGEILSKEVSTNVNIWDDEW